MWYVIEFTEYVYDADYGEIPQTRFYTEYREDPPQPDTYVWAKFNTEKEAMDYIESIDEP